MAYSLAPDNYRYEGGRVCDNKPVRADYLDSVVWDHITGLLADPQLIRDEIDKRLNAAKTSDPPAPAPRRPPGHRRQPTPPQH
jgi:site-specific DNA recombinase